MCCTVAVNAIMACHMSTRYCAGATVGWCAGLLAVTAPDGAIPLALISLASWHTPQLLHLRKAWHDRIMGSSDLQSAKDDKLLT
jgi:hypothetical protein